MNFRWEFGAADSTPSQHGQRAIFEWPQAATKLQTFQGTKAVNAPHFINELNPTPDELRRWAYAPGAMAPAQDWDLCIVDFKRAHLFIEFASDQSCPNRMFFLACLYLLAGDTVGDPTEQGNLPKISALLNTVASEAPDDLHLWVARTRHLLTHPETSLDYDQWRPRIL